MVIALKGFKMINKSINFLVKPTNGCNLRCKYCFSNDYKFEYLSIKDFEKFMSIVCKEVNSLQIVWHGGEPTLWGFENFCKAFEIIDKYKNKVKIRQSIQSNCIHIDQKLLDLLIKNNVTIGSSFDGLYNDLTRGGTDKYNKTIDILKEKNINVGAICVITKQTVSKLKENYEFFKSRNQSLNLRPMIVDGSAENYEKEFGVDIDEYVKNLVNLLKIWFYDENCNINVQPFDMYLNMIIANKTSVCCNNSCLGNWFCLEANGDITPCNRTFPTEFTYGNIKEISTFDEIYNSQAMCNLLKLAIERRSKCKNECEYFDLCKGGCNHEALINGNIANNNMPSCKIIKTILPLLKQLINSFDGSKAINPKIKEKVVNFKNLTKH